MVHVTLQHTQTLSANHANIVLTLTHLPNNAQATLDAHKVSRHFLDTVLTPTQCLNIHTPSRHSGHLKNIQTPVLNVCMYVHMHESACVYAKIMQPS